MKQKKGFTLVELVVSACIVVIIVIMFGTILKQVIMFIDYSKQQFSMLNEVTSIKREIGQVFSNKKIKLFRKEICTSTGTIIYTSSGRIVCNYVGENIYTSTGVYSVKDTIFSIKDNSKNLSALMSKDILIFQDKNQSSPDIYMMGIISKKTKTLLYDDDDSSGLFGITKLNPDNNTMTGVYNQEFGGPCNQKTSNNANEYKFCDYINTNLNILGFRHTIINNGAFLRIDIDYDNNILDEIQDKTNKEFYFSGSIHVIKKLD